MRNTADIDCEYTDQIVCPYCGCEQYDSWERGDRDGGETTCDDCEKDFEFSRNHEITYSSMRIDCKKGNHTWRCDEFWIDDRNYENVDGDYQWVAKPREKWNPTIVVKCLGCEQVAYFNGNEKDEESWREIMRAPEEEKQKIRHTLKHWNDDTLPINTSMSDKKWCTRDHKKHEKYTFENKCEKCDKILPILQHKKICFACRTPYL